MLREIAFPAPRTGRSRWPAQTRTILKTRGEVVRMPPNQAKGKLPYHQLVKKLNLFNEAKGTRITERLGFAMQFGVKLAVRGL